MADPLDPRDRVAAPDRDAAEAEGAAADGSESYPLESPGDDAPLGADPPPPRPPCPACGAPRRLAEPFCLQCGHDERPPGSVKVDSGRGEGKGEASEDFDAEAAALAEDPGEDGPLLRPWPGGGRAAWILGGIVLLGLFVAALSGTTAFPPAMLEEGRPPGPLVHLALAIRVVAAAIFWSAAAWGAGLASARTEGRPVGGMVELGGRMLLVAAVSRLPILLPIAEPLAAFLLEGFLALLVLAAGLWGALRVTWLRAAGLAGLTAFLVGSAALLAKVVAWVLA